MEIDDAGNQERRKSAVRNLLIVPLELFPDGE